MKKYVVRLTALLLVLGAIACLIYADSRREYWVMVETDAPSLSGVTLELDRAAYHKKEFILSYTLSNGTKYDICWGADLGGRVEQWTKDGWRFRESRPRKGAEYPAVEYMIRSGEAQTEEISLRAALPRLTPGQYRYARYYNLGGTGQQYASYALFTIE